MASRIEKQATAFALSSGRKGPRRKDEKHLARIRKLPCVVCGSRSQIEAAHIRTGCLNYAKAETGMGRKPDDMWTVPLCRFCHREQHSMNELAFFAREGINPFLVALALWAAGHNQHRMEIIIMQARSET